MARLVELRRTVPRRTGANRHRDHHAQGLGRSQVSGRRPEGLPEPRKFSSAWALGEPDLTLTMPEPYKLAATGDDDFRVFVLQTNLPEDRWIRAVDFRPGNRSVVHHIIAAVDPSGRGRKLDAGDPGPGYYALGGFGDGVPSPPFCRYGRRGPCRATAPKGRVSSCLKEPTSLSKCTTTKTASPRPTPQRSACTFRKRRWTARFTPGSSFPTSRLAR